MEGWEGHGSDVVGKAGWEGHRRSGSCTGGVVLVMITVHLNRLQLLLVHLRSVASSPQ